MSDHTPGPWEAGRPDMSTIVDGVPSKWIYAGETYVAVASGMASLDFDVVMANAYLIAAAPEMYEALKYIRENCFIYHDSSMDIDNDACRLADAALAKAKGGESGS
jgi:hypothetical protein